MGSSQMPDSLGCSSTHPKEPINLMRGWPAPDLLPAQSLQRAAHKVLASAATYVPALQYGTAVGYQPLREELARWLAGFYGGAPDPERICITGGASQSLASILQSYTDPVYTRAVWMAAPCYFLACPVFMDAGFGGRLRGFPEDDEGADLAYLERGLEGMEGGEDDAPAPRKEAKDRKIYRYVIYVVPTCANPSGKSMSTARRTGLVQLARKYDALVVCDDVYDLLQWSGSPDWAPPTASRPREMRLPRLSDIDRDLGPSEHDGRGFGHAVSNGSFSKLAGPGLRTGWVDAAPAFAFGLAQTGSTKSGGAPSQLSATMVYDMLHSGELGSHVEDAIRPALQRRHRRLMDAIGSRLEPLGVVAHGGGPRGSAVYGGYFVWLSLPAGLLAQTVAERARQEQNLEIGQGDLFEVRGDETLRFEDKIRLSFSWEREEALTEGVERLAAVLEAMMA